MLNLPTIKNGFSTTDDALQISYIDLNVNTCMRETLIPVNVIIRLFRQVSTDNSQHKALTALKAQT